MNSESTSNKQNSLHTAQSIFFSRRPDHHIDLEDFAGSLKKIGSFDTLEEFQRYQVYLAKPNKLPEMHNLMIFRKDLTPAQEAFPNGGCWIIRVRKSNRLIERLQEELAFAAISEQFLDPDMVGIVLSIRERNDILSIWNRGAKMKRNGEKLKEILNLDIDSKVEYQNFSEALINKSTFRNARLYTYAVQNSSIKNDQHRQIENEAYMDNYEYSDAQQYPYFYPYNYSMQDQQYYNNMKYNWRYKRGAQQNYYGKGNEGKHDKKDSNVPRRRRLKSKKQSQKKQNLKKGLNKKNLKDSKFDQDKSQNLNENNDKLKKTDLTEFDKNENQKFINV